MSRRVINCAKQCLSHPFSRIKWIDQWAVESDPVLTSTTSAKIGKTAILHLFARLVRSGARRIDPQVQIELAKVPFCRINHVSNHIFVRRWQPTGNVACALRTVQSELSLGAQPAGPPVATGCLPVPSLLPFCAGAGTASPCFSLCNAMGRRLSVFLYVPNIIGRLGPHEVRFSSVVCSSDGSGVLW